MQSTKICAHCGQPFGIGNKPKANFLRAKYCGSVCGHARKKHTPEQAIAAFWAKVDKGGAGGCWLWKAARDKWGYGQHGVKMRRVQAHRFSYEMTKGPIPKGMLVLHRCDTPLCVRPDHLFAGTDADNKADSVAKGRHAHGERNSHAKLTEDQVRAVRRDWTGENKLELAARYNVIPGTIYCAATRRTWKYLK